MSDGRSRNGGPRPGAGSPGKPHPTEAEWAIIDSTKSLAAKARLLSQHRIDGAKDPRTIKKRSVSPYWISEKIKMRRESNRAREASMQNPPETTGDWGPRINPSSLEETSTDFLQGPVKESPQPTGKVEVTSGGEKA